MDQFRTRENILKGVAAVVGVVTVGITGGSVYSQLSEDSFVLATTILAFLYSLALVILIAFKKIPETALSHKIEAIACFTFVLLLAIAAIVFAVTTFQYNFIESIKISRIFGLVK